jgi:protein gp37
MEPILEPFPYPSSPEALRDNWIIMGAETGNRANKVVPERGWVEPYVNFCKENNIPVFMKDSMRAVWGEDIITEFPWGD